MQDSAMQGGSTSLENEHLPPLDEPQARGLPWQRQLDAAQAWQEAGANADGEACQWFDPRDLASGGAESAGTGLTMQTVVRMNTLNVALRERLLRLTGEISNLAIAQMGARPEGGTAQLDEAAERRLAGLTRRWFDLMETAQATMSALTGIAPPGRELAERGQRVASPLVDRRQRVVEIDFADRRRAG